MGGRPGKSDNEAALQEAVELKVDVSVPDDAKKALKEAEEMCVRWEGKRKAKEEYAAHKAEEEEASHKDKEPAQFRWWRGRQQ